jgi:hypothetical protein
MRRVAVVERLHVNAGGQVEHVGVVRIPRFELAEQRDRCGRLTFRDDALHQGEAGEAGQIVVG